MTLTIKEGGHYRTRDGRKVGPMQRPERTDLYKWFAQIAGETGCVWYSGEGGTFHGRGEPPHDLDVVSKWQDGIADLPDDEPKPTRTVTRIEIVPGEYGIIGVGQSSHVGVPVGIVSHSAAYRWCNAAELRAAARTFNLLAEALEQDK